MQFGSWQTDIEVEPRRLVRAVHDETRQAGLLKLLPAPAAKRESMLAAFGAQQGLGGGEKSGWLQIYEYGLYGENQCYVVYQEATHRLDSDITQGFTPSAHNVRDFGLAILAALIRLRDKAQRPHGNLKPANVFFAGDYGNVLLTDPAPLDSSGGGAYRSDMQALGILIYQVVRSKSAAPRFMQSLPDDQPLWPSTASEKRDALWRSFVGDLMSGKYDEQPIEAVAREFRRLSGSSGRPLAVMSVCVALVGVAAAAYFFLPAIRQYFNDRKHRIEVNEEVAQKDAQKRVDDQKAKDEQAAKDREKQEHETAEQQKDLREKDIAQAKKDYEDGNDDGVVSLSDKYPRDPDFSDLATNARKRISLRTDKEKAIQMFTNGAYANYDFIDQWGSLTNQPEFDDIRRAALGERDSWVEWSKKASGSPKEVVDYLNDPTNRNLLAKKPFKDLLQTARENVATEADKRRKADELAKEQEMNRDWQEATEFLKKGDYASVHNRADKYLDVSRFKEIAMRADSERKKLAEAEDKLKSGVDDKFRSYLDDVSSYRGKQDWNEFFKAADNALKQYNHQLESDADFKKGQDFFDHGSYADAIDVCQSRSSEPRFGDLLKAVEAETNAFYSANQEFDKVAGPEDLNRLENRDTYSNYITNGKPVWVDFLKRVNLVKPAVQYMSTNSDAAIAYLTTDVDAESRAKPPFEGLLACATSDVDYRKATNSFQTGDYTNALNWCSPHKKDLRFGTLEGQIEAEQGDLKMADQRLNEKADTFPEYVAGLAQKYPRDGKAPWIDFYKRAAPVCVEVKQRLEKKDQISTIDADVAKIENALMIKKAIGVVNINNLVNKLDKCRERYRSLDALPVEKDKGLDSLKQRIQKHDDNYPPVDG